MAAADFLPFLPLSSVSSCTEIDPDTDTGDGAGARADEDAAMVGVRGDGVVSSEECFPRADAESNASPNALILAAPVMLDNESKTPATFGSITLTSSMQSSLLNLSLGLAVAVACLLIFILVAL